MILPPYSALGRVAIEILGQTPLAASAAAAIEDIGHAWDFNTTAELGGYFGWTTNPAITAETLNGGTCGVASHIGPAAEGGCSFVPRLTVAEGDTVSVEGLMRNPSFGGSPKGFFYLYWTAGTTGAGSFDVATGPYSIVELPDSGDWIRFSVTDIPVPIGMTTVEVNVRGQANPGVGAGWVNTFHWDKWELKVTKRKGQWLDVTPQSMVMKLGWGADDPAGILTVPAAGHWSVTTYDPERRLDPSNGSSPHSIYLKPGRPMRITTRRTYGHEGVDVFGDIGSMGTGWALTSPGTFYFEQGAITSPNGGIVATMAGPIENDWQWVTATSDGGAYYRPVIPGQRYRLGGWHRAAGNLSKMGSIRMHGSTADGQYVGIVAECRTPPTTAWVWMETEWTCPENIGAVVIELCIVAGGNGQAISASEYHQYDGVSLVGLDTIAEQVRLGLLDEVEYDIYSQKGGLRGTDIVPLIVNAKLTEAQVSDPLMPTTLRARAAFLLDKAGLKALVPVEGASGKVDLLNGEGSFENYNPLDSIWGNMNTQCYVAPYAGAPDGSKILHIQGLNGTPYPSVQTVDIPVTPGKSYWLEGWMANAGNINELDVRVDAFLGDTEVQSFVLRLLYDQQQDWAFVTNGPWVCPEGVDNVHLLAYIAHSASTPVNKGMFDGIKLLTTVDDPPVGPLPVRDASVWSLIGTSAFDCLNAMWIDRHGVMRFRSFGDPVDKGFQVGGDAGIPISTIATNASIQNIYTVVRAFDQDTPTVPYVKQNDDAVAIYGIIPLTREKPVPDAEFWATNVLNDRSASALQYDTGTLYPRTEAELRQLVELEMIDVVHIIADDIDPPLNLSARLLGADLIADTDTGWTAEVRTYIPAAEWLDAGTPPVEPPVDPPPTTHQETRYYNATKDTRAARDSGGTALGSGTEGELPVGAWQGWRNRAFIDFADIPWDRVVSVDSCILELDTSTQVNVGFGSSPKVIVARVTQSWNEGSSSSPSGSNSTKYPGPSATSTNQVTKSVTRSENAAVSIDITGICRDWKNGQAQHGVRIISSGEDSTTYTTEFWSRENSSSGRRPRLVVLVTVEDVTEQQPAEAL